MRTALHTPFADSRADQLVWLLGDGPRDALAALPLTLDDVDLELRLLGASHQVLVRSSRGDCSETVACLMDRAGHLPEAVDQELPGWQYRFRSAVAVLGAEEFALRVKEVVRLVEAHPAGLVGQFPGSPLAITALLVEPAEDGIRWRTWHAYPQNSQLVSTRSWIAAS